MNITFPGSAASAKCPSGRGEMLSCASTILGCVSPTSGQAKIGTGRPRGYFYGDCGTDYRCAASCACAVGRPHCEAVEVAAVGVFEADESVADLQTHQAVRIGKVPGVQLTSQEAKGRRAFTRLAMRDWGVLIVLGLVNIENVGKERSNCGVSQPACLVLHRA